MNVDVPGRGIVEFPDDMPQEQVEKAIKDWLGTPEEKPPGAVETFAREAGIGVAPALAASAAFEPGFAAGVPLAEFAGPAAPLVPLATGGLASLAAGGLTEFAEQKGLEKAAPGFMERTAAGVKEHPVAGFLGRMAAPAAGFELAPFQAARGLLALPKVLRGTAEQAERKAAASLAAQVGAQTGITAAQTGLLEHRLPTAGELLESATFAGLYGHPRQGLRLPLPETLQTKLGDYYAAQKRKLEESRQRERPGTGALRETTETGGGNRPAPATGLEEEAQIPLSPEGYRVMGGGRFESDTPPPPEAFNVTRTEVRGKVTYKFRLPAAPENKPDISGNEQAGFTLRLHGKEEVFKTEKEAQDAAVDVLGGQREMGGKPAVEDDFVARMEREAIDQGEAQGVKFELKDKPPEPEDPTVPFAQKFMQALGGDKAALYRTNFAKWLIQDLRGKGLSEAQIKEAIRSRVGEEKFHNDVIGVAKDEDIEQYARDLTAAEKAIERRIYGAPLENDLQVGHEAIRRRLQQAHMMTPSEFAETVGREHWTIKGLDYLGRIIRRSREALGTQAAARQANLYNRALRNIEYAKVALGGTQGPAASRRHDPRRESPEMSRELEEKLIDNFERRNRLSPQAEAASKAQGYEPNIYTALDWYAQQPDSKWGLNNRDRAALINWFKKGEASGWGRAAMLESHLQSAESWAKHLLAVSEGREKREYFDPPMANISEHAQSAIDDLVRLRQLLEQLTGEKYPKLETPSESDEQRFNVKWLRDNVKRIESDIADMEDKQRKYQDKLPNLTRRELEDFQSMQWRIPNWRATLNEYRNNLSDAEARMKEQGVNQDLSKPIVDRPPEPPEHPQLPFASRRKTAREIAEEERAREQGQASMFGNVEKTPSLIPPTPPEQRQVETARPAGQLENAAAHIFAGFNPPVEARATGEGPPVGEATEPTFQNFLKWARRNVSETIPSGPLFDVWLDTVNKTIENAPGSKLNDMVEKLDVKHRVYPWKKKFAGAPRDYTRVEIPDFQQIPPDPTRLPLSIEASIRARVAETPMFEEGTMSEEELAKAQDKAVEKARKEIMALSSAEDIKARAAEREAVIKRQKLRSKALSAIYQKVIEEGMPTITDLTPKDITTEDIAWNNPNTDFGAYRTITPEERANPEKLRSILADEARRSSSDPVSHTRRLVVMLNKRSGEVALVSAYPHGRRGILVNEPSGATGRRGKPNVSLTSAMARGWDPIITVLRKEPIKDFYKGFKDIAEYNRYLGTEAAQLDRTSTEEFVGERREDAYSDIPEGSAQDWQVLAREMEPTEHDLARIMEERDRPTEEFVGPMPSEVVGEEFRPGTRVERGEGGSVTGPEAGAVREGPGQRTFASSPLSTREALAIHNWLNDPEEWSGTTGITPDIEKATTQPAMREALQRLYDLAANNKLKPRQWNAIVALRKMAIEQYRRDRIEFAEFVREEKKQIPKGLTREQRTEIITRLHQAQPTPEGAMVTALDRLYEYNQIAQSQAEYLSHVMGEFARPIPEAKGPQAVQAAPTGARELTLPRFSRRSVPAEQLPGDLGRATEPSAAEILTPDSAKFVAQQAAQQFNYEPTQVLRSLPVTPTKVGGEKFAGDAPPVYGKPPALMAHEFRDEPLVYSKTAKQLREEFIGPRGPERGLGPAASIREVRERIAREWAGIPTFVRELFTPQKREELVARSRKYGAVPYKRAQTEHDILAGADGADRQVELYAAHGGNDIRIASVKPGGKATLKERLLGGIVFGERPKQIRESGLAIQEAMHAAMDREWKRVTDAWAQAKLTMAPIQDAARAAGRPVPSIPARLRPTFNKPEWIELRDLDSAIEKAQRGIDKAQEMMRATINPLDRLNGLRWKRAAERLLRAAQWAKENFNEPELRKTWDTYHAVQNQHLANMNQYGLNVTGRDFYVPGLHEGEQWSDEAITFGDMRILGRNFRLPKTYRSYYHAISEGPYIPVNYDLADLAQHSLAAGGRIMARETWFDGLKHIVDPESGKPVAIEPEWGFVKPPEMSQSAFDEWVAEVRKHISPTGDNQAVPMSVLNDLLRELGVSKRPYGFKVPKGQLDYDLVRVPDSSAKPLAIRAGYRNLVETAMAKSQVRDLPVLSQALTASQMLKHGLILIIDTFHPGRLAQYAGALAGKNIWGLEKPGFHKGLSALMWRPESLDEAVSIGAITQKQADWARTPIRLYDRGSIKTLTRQEALRLMLTRGLNATQTADTLYRNSIQRIPFIGNQWNQLLSPLNKWIFDRITPGVIAESALSNLERINPKNRHLSLDAQVREVVRDMNVFYGNLGRNGIFKHPTARDLAQILLLAPLWQEGLLGKELRTFSRLTGASWLMGRRGLGANVYFGPLTRGVARGLGAYFVLTQMVNLATRGKWTFQNDEKDHKLDAWLPVGGEQGIWLSPMSVFGEVTHDLTRLAESKPKTWDGITQFGRNKLGPIGRLAWILAEGKSPTGEEITSTTGVVGRAARELAPAPISIGTYARAAGHAVAPGLVGPTRPGKVPQQILSSVGIKTQPSTRPETDLRRLAADFVKSHNLSYEPLAFTPTDQASYAKLRGALRNNDESGAAQILMELRQHRSNEQILKAMRIESQRPFAGSRANENMFLYSLDQKGLALYFKANMDRATDYQHFLGWYLKQPMR